MFKITGLSKSFCGCCIFKNVALSVSLGEHVGLTGRPGSGKTTLLRIILGMENWQGGMVAIRPATWFGYLPQHAIHPCTYMVRDVLQTARHDFHEIRNETDISRAHVHTGSRENHESEGCDAKGAFVSCDHWGTLQIQRDIMAGLELQYVAPQYRLKQLGPAEQRRIWLASLLLARPDVLVLDDPTIGLNISTSEWLESHLKAYEGTVLLASQDRSFLNRVTDKIWGVIPEHHAVVEYGGNRLGSPHRRAVVMN
jgi:ATP-binding cassette subfamily F protein 3